jgi:hypothetical protein
MIFSDGKLILRHIIFPLLSFLASHVRITITVLNEKKHIKISHHFLDLTLGLFFVLLLIVSSEVTLATNPYVQSKF